MWRGPALFFSLVAAQVLPAVGAYIWPAQTDALEDVIFNDSGYNAAGVGSHIIRCGDEGRGGPGSQVAAAWVNKNSNLPYAQQKSNDVNQLRTAYHDMITYRGAERAGGLDGSIIFETDRMENIGIGFNNTFLYVTFCSLSISSHWLTVQKRLATRIQLSRRNGRLDHRCGLLCPPQVRWSRRRCPRRSN